MEEVGDGCTFTDHFGKMLEERGAAFDVAELEDALEQLGRTVSNSHIHV
jgi:hypothetical protein